MLEARLFLDMDGVLADFDHLAEHVLGTDNSYKWEWVHGGDAFWERLNGYPEFFYNLRPLPDAMLLWGNVRHLNPIVLTALPDENEDDVRRQKKAWIAKYLDPSITVITCKTKEKPGFCLPGDILVDDRAVNRKAWAEAGGRFVLHTSAEETLEQLRDWGIIS